MRAALFAANGIALFAFWAIDRPSNEMTAAMQEWPNVLWFSATLALLAVAVAAFGRMVGGTVGGRTVVRASSLAAVGIAISAIANILEDGFRIEPAFFGFVLGTLIHEVSLLVLGIAIVRGSAGRERLRAIVPAGSMAGFLFFVVAGGPILLATWLVAAAVAVALSRNPQPDPVAGLAA